AGDRQPRITAGLGQHFSRVSLDGLGRGIDAGVTSLGGKFLEQVLGRAPDAAMAIVGDLRGVTMRNHRDAVGAHRPEREVVFLGDVHGGHECVSAVVRSVHSDQDIHRWEGEERSHSLTVRERSGEAAVATRPWAHLRLHEAPVPAIPPCCDRVPGFSVEIANLFRPWRLRKEVAPMTGEHTASAESDRTPWAAPQRRALFAGVGSWTLDGLDYFILVFVLTDVANGLKSTVTTASLAITLTLLLRPIGAIIFGALAEKFGRKHILALNIVLYSVIEVISAVSPTMVFFLFTRVFYGIMMGGIWGVASA